MATCTFLAQDSTLLVTGSLDARSTPELRGAISLLLDLHGEVTLDLQAVEVIDRTALNVIAYATWQAQLAGQQVALRGCSPVVRRMLHLSHLVRVVRFDRRGASAPVSV